MKFIKSLLFLGILLVGACSPQPYLLQTPAKRLEEPGPLSTTTAIYDNYPAPTVFNQIEWEDVEPIKTDFPETKNGKTYLRGILYSYTIDSIIPGTGIYLTPAVGDNNDEFPTMLVGPQESRGDTTTFSNLEGIFEFNDVEPGNYYLIVWAPLSWSVVINSETDQQPMLIELSADQQLDMGIALVSWP
jgi:hypothetical protein